MGEVSDDCQAQARATETPRGRGVGLGERVEDAFEAVNRDADAGIIDDDTGAETLAPWLEFKVAVDVAVFSELDRVADEVG